MKADQELLLNELFQYQEGKIQLFFSIFQGINLSTPKMISNHRHRFHSHPRHRKNRPHFRLKIHISPATLKCGYKLSATGSNRQ
jgi:hypothetical protein